MIKETNASLFLLIGSVLAGSAVAAGAFGAHLLKGTLDVPMLAVFDTATRYQMYHALGLCIVSWKIERKPDGGFSTVGWLFTAGIGLFCGSLYGLSLADIRWLGSITPLGGAAFIAGWSLLAWRVWQQMTCVGHSS